jgi:hypothetical protein
MFDFNVICFEEDGTTNIEYSIDGKSCVDHNNEYGDKTLTFTSIEDNNCKDISLSESMHSDDQFVIKKPNESISNVDLLFLSLIDLPAEQSFTKVFKYFNTTQSNSIKQIKTVSLLI